MRRLFLAVLCSIVVSGFAAASAVASRTETAATPRDRYVVRLNAADQAAAKAAVLQRRDFGAGWRGGARKPQIQNSSDCTYFKPRANDIVITGAAASEFSAAGGVSASTETHIVQRQSMVGLDWQRVVEAPAYHRCLRESMTKELAREGWKVRAVQRTPFPRVASRVARFRLVAEYPQPGRSAGLVLDSVFIGTGRTEITLIVGAPLGDLAAAHAAEVRLSRILVARARA